LTGEGRGATGKGSLKEGAPRTKKRTTESLRLEEGKGLSCGGEKIGREWKT